ncbi:unnamed protein product, partial [Scytosiphon promiscuus]
PLGLHVLPPLNEHGDRIGTTRACALMVRCSILPGLVALFWHHLPGAVAQYDACNNGTVASIGDGQCDAVNNNPSCGFDGGDCCTCTCSDGPLHSCSDNDLDCIYPGCGELSSATSTTGACIDDWHGDGMCDASQNSASCGFDGGDCCICTCTDGPSFTCGEVGYNCQDPACMDPILVAEFPDCPGDWLLVGDGSCDDDLNNPLCGYDGGDCCICSCIESICTVNTEFDCLDSAAGDELFKCVPPPPAGLPCSEEAQQQWVVSDPAHVQLLAAAINCSGGLFEVEWKGDVVVDESIYVADRTVLKVFGAESGAVINGNASTRLFTIVNASLHLSNLNVSSGASTAGGAIAAAGSSLILNRTYFIENKADSHGGAVYVSDGSSVSCVGGGTFLGNEAGFDGGAMFVTGESVASCGGLWANNRAARNGGGVFASDGSSLSWDASTEFSSNIAGVSGGAVAVYSNSLASWSGVTTYADNVASAGGALATFLGSTTWWNVSTTFTRNNADIGGAVRVYRSNLSWSGDGTGYYENRATSHAGGMDIVQSNVSCANSTYAENSAVGRGGALHVDSGSSVLFEGSTLFQGNRAVSNPDLYESGYGGGLVVVSSRVAWSEHMHFVNNSAEAVGGVLYVSESSVSWSEGTTSFHGNTALSGGAIFLWNGSTITWTGDTEFTSNQALGDGGAVASPAFDSVFNYLDSSLIINGTTVFANNTCGANGGALAMVEGLSLVLDAAVDTSFVANHAAVAGGAVFVSGTAVGPEFTEIAFVSNFAQVGGAVSLVGSGNMKGFADVESPNPTTFERCHFIDNHAAATGGAIESAAGQDSFVDCSFEGNQARAGGALRLAGTASLENCSFEDNVSADQGGSAVSNIGLILRIHNISFSNNVFDCEPETYLHFNIDLFPPWQAGHPYAIVCSECEATCDQCFFDTPNAFPTCAELMAHSESAGGNTTLATVSIDPGYWRATNSSTEVLACYNADACLGGVTGRAGYCQEGYEGAYCSVCSDGYTPQLSFACSKCSESASGIAVMVVLGVVVLCVGVAAASYVMSGNISESRRGPVRRLLGNIPLHSVKIVIAAWQILTQARMRTFFVAVVNVTYPDVYQDFLDGLDVFNFGLGWILSAGCVVDLDFHHRLVISTVGPLVALLFLAGTYTVATTINGGAPDALQTIWNRHVSMVLLLTFLVYSSVSALLFRTFACETLEDGINYLRVDYRIICDSPRHRAFQVYAGFMIVFYTVGIPFFYGALLFRDRDVLKNDADNRESNPRVATTSDLWKPYKPSAYYYEVVECCRRLLLTGVVVFIYPGTAAQIAVTLLMAFFFVVLAEVLAPYTSGWDAWLSRIGHAVVFVSMYVALLLKVDVSNERAESQKVFEIVLVGAHACMVLMVVVETVLLTCSLKAEQRPVPSLQ